jgi:hypothetical protein
MEKMALRDDLTDITASRGNFSDEGGAASEVALRQDKY